MESVNGSSGTAGAWAAYLAAPQKRAPEAVAASRKLWAAAYPEEPYDVDMDAVTIAPCGEAGSGQSRLLLLLLERKLGALNVSLVRKRDSGFLKPSQDYDWGS